MHRHLRNTLLVILAIAFFSACNKMPDHARYIPKDAVAVASINLKGLSKKVAWNMITGSKLFKEMQKRIPEQKAKDAMAGIEKAGIDALNTFYVYMKTDTRFKGGNRVTALVPLADAGQWEAYVKQVFPKAAVKQHGDRKEVRLGDDMFVSWNNKLMIIINVMEQDNDVADADSNGAALPTKPAGDETALSAEMDNAFGITKENSILGNSRFTGLEKEGHDVAFWLNYELLMTQMDHGMAGNMGMSLSSALWKDAGMTAGFDFVKGKISGDFKYYMSAELKDICSELGGTNADKDMIERLPNQNLDMVMALHLSPKGLKGVLEKMGMLGLANIALGSQGLNTDTILDAFTGDMAIVMNDFALHTETVTDSFMGQAITHKNNKPSLSLSYVMKLNKKENFQKLVKMATDMGLKQTGSGFVIPLTEKDTVYIQMNDQYMIASNKNNYAGGFLQGSFKGQKMPEAASSVVFGHPCAFYMDIQQLFKNVDAGMNNSAHDSVMIAESKKLLNNIAMKGGEFKNNAFEYHMEINFMNTEENSIIALMDYGMKMSDADTIKAN